MEWKKWQGSNWCWGSALTIHTSPGLRVGRVAGVIPRCLQPKAGLHPAQVASLSQNHKDTTLHTRTHWYRQFRVPSCLCLWTMGGSTRTWRELCTIGSWKLTWISPPSFLPLRWAASAPAASDGPSPMAGARCRGRSSWTRRAWACTSASSATWPTRSCPARRTGAGTSTRTACARRPSSLPSSPSCRWASADPARQKSTRHICFVFFLTRNLPSPPQSAAGYSHCSEGSGCSTSEPLKRFSGFDQQLLLWALYALVTHLGVRGLAAATNSIPSRCNTLSAHHAGVFFFF